MTPEFAKALEGVTKVLVALGAFLSAVAGIYLGVDAVEKETSEVFRTKWLWFPLPLIPVISWILTFFLDQSTALYLGYCWAMAILFIISIALVVMRVYIARQKMKKAVKKPKHRKVAWILLVLGFDLLFSGALVDAIAFYMKG